MEEEFEKWWKDYQTSQEFRDQGWSQTIRNAFLAGCEAQRKRCLEWIESIDANQMHRDTKRCLSAAIESERSE